ncbi:hypothetical protein ACRASX_14810 [Flavobacterium sp. TMP13]|uniref:hypothetical protein n=1 Tax=unclassified Flavobacterium TaxID=196869 RepID=UPI00076C9B31|nr:hypothetical protein [Flavobacterium sp. TAB 87]KVV16198.1 hypothetical protein AP058_00256 [Flavobacterium sp. TAB 87]
MDQSNSFSNFFVGIQNDFRISTTHIAIYMALLQSRIERGFANPIQVFAKEVMPIAKVSSQRTYNKILHDLNDYGYIKYVISFKKNEGSKVYFMDNTH